MTSHGEGTSCFGLPPVTPSVPKQPSVWAAVGGYHEASFNVYDAALTTTDEIVRIDPRRIGNDYNPRRGWVFGKLTKLRLAMFRVEFLFFGGFRGRWW